MAGVVTSQREAVVAALLHVDNGYYVFKTLQWFRLCY